MAKERPNMADFLHIILLCTCAGAAAGLTPVYVWPLGNTTLNTEVMARLDAIIPDQGQCFRFRQGYPDLPYDALQLSGDKDSHVDISLDGNLTLKDFTLSFMTYPEGSPRGTLLNYLYKTGNIIKVAMLENYLFVSFWDEYGVSVGSTALPDVLTADSWTHIVVSREFLTGRISVYSDGVLLEDLDDDFPNEIQLPAEGALRLGNCLDEPEDPFIGRISCFQIYDFVVGPQEAGLTKENCLPSAWNHSPQVNMERRYVDGEVRQCISDGSHTASVNCDVISIQCLVGGRAWEGVLGVNNWANSGLDLAYFGDMIRDLIPAAQTEHILGTVPITDVKVCSRLCMRVKGCQAFFVGGKHPIHCTLLDQKLEATLPKPGWKYFIMKPS